MYGSILTRALIRFNCKKTVRGLMRGFSLKLQLMRLFLKLCQSLSLFINFRLFKIVLKFVNGLIRTAELWLRKLPLNQLSQNQYDNILDTMRQTNTRTILATHNSHKGGMGELEWKWEWRSVWPDWAIFKVLGYKFCYKSTPNIWQLSLSHLLK